MTGAALFRQILSFSVAGGIGFCVDAGVTQFCVSVLEMGPLAGRVPGFALAVVTTWILNRRVTFRSASPGRPHQFMIYAAAMVLGGVINWAVYSALVVNWAVAADWPVLALVPATAAAMCFNFAAMRWLVFRPRS